MTAMFCGRMDETTGCQELIVGIQICYCKEDLCNNGTVTFNSTGSKLGLLKTVASVSLAVTFSALIFW